MMIKHVLGVAFAVAASAGSAHAFCGFYVSGSGDKMFNDAKIFQPERWLESLERYQELENRRLSFSRGSRSCLGVK